MAAPRGRYPPPVPFLAGSPEKLAELVRRAERARAAGELEDLGGYPYIAELWDAAPTAANAEYYTRTVRDMAARRRLIHLCGEMSRDAYDLGEPADQLVGRFESRIFCVADGAAADQLVPLYDAVMDVFADIDERAAGRRPTFIPTQLAALDEVIGGLHPERLIVLTARPSVGKSAMMLALALAAARQGVPALVFSLEMSVKEFAQRTLATTFGVPLNQINGTTALDRATATRMAEGAGECRIPVWIDGRPDHTAVTVAATNRRAVRKHGVGLVVVDYLQLLDHGGSWKDTLAARVGNSARKLKFLARTLRVPVVCLAQLNRDPERRAEGQPKLSDLRDSGEIEQHADDVLMLWPQEVVIQPDGTPCPVQEVRLCVEKQRNGPKAIVSLNYVRRFVRYRNAGIPI